jgi:hypothetical protein
MPLKVFANAGKQRRAETEIRLRVMGYTAMAT